MHRVLLLLVLAQAWLPGLAVLAPVVASAVGGESCADACTCFVESPTSCCDEETGAVQLSAACCCGRDRGHQVTPPRAPALAVLPVTSSSTSDRNPAPELLAEEELPDSRRPEPESPPPRA